VLGSIGVATVAAPVAPFAQSSRGTKTPGGTKTPPSTLCKFIQYIVEAIQLEWEGHGVAAPRSSHSVEMGRPRRSSTPLGGKAPGDSSEGAGLDEGASSKVHATPTELPPSACAQSVSAVPSDATNVPIGVTGKQPPMTPRIRVRSATEAQQPGPLTARWDAMASVGATRSLCSGKLQRVLYSVALENARVAGTSAAQRGIARRQLMGVRPSLHAPEHRIVHAYAVRGQAPRGRPSKSPPHAFHIPRDGVCALRWRAQAATAEGSDPSPCSGP
jgi:hypothetical protein